MLKADVYAALGQLQARLEDPEDTLEEAVQVGDAEGTSGNGVVANLGVNQENGSQNPDAGTNRSGQHAPARAGESYESNKTTARVSGQSRVARLGWAEATPPRIVDIPDCQV